MKNTLKVQRAILDLTQKIWRKNWSFTSNNQLN